MLPGKKKNNKKKNSWNCLGNFKKFSHTKNAACDHEGEISNALNGVQIPAWRSGIGSAYH